MTSSAAIPETYHPVDPGLDDQGRLRALVPILGPAASVPVPRPGPGASWAVERATRIGPTPLYNALGVTRTATREAPWPTRTAVWEALVGQPALRADQPTRSAIRATFWGVGLRVAITFGGVQRDRPVTVADIAAQVDSGRARAHYQIAGLGLGPRELADTLSAIPPLGRFDTRTFEALVDLSDNLVATLQDRLFGTEARVVVLQPALVALTHMPFGDPLADAAEYRFTVQSICAGLTLEQTLDRRDGAHWRDVRPDRVEAIYRDLVGTAREPDATARKRARTWLEFVR